MDTLESLQSRIPTLQEWRDRATRMQQQKRILELEDRLKMVNASDCEQMTRYEEELAGAQGALLQAQQRILELESKLGDADRTYSYWRGETLMLEKRLFELMEDAARDRGEIERLNRMLLKALETLLLEE